MCRPIRWASQRTTFNEIGDLPTFDNFEGGLDKKDVSFRVWIDFEPAAVDETEREMIWESGGGTVGLSLVYEAGNKLVLRAAGNGGNDCHRCRTCADG